MRAPAHGWPDAGFEGETQRWRRWPHDEEQGLIAARAVALSALVLAILLAGYLLLFRGGSGHEYTLLFQTAGQLVKDDDVQVGGRRIGSVRSIELTDDNLAAIRVKVQEPYAPLREGTRAVIRLTSLSGIANRYVALTLAPRHRASSSTTAPRSTCPDDRRRRPRPALQHARQEDPRRPPGRHPGLRHAVRGQGRGGGPVGEVLQPAAVDLARAGQPAHRRTRARSPASS